ncbi:hypothetical protein QAD02_020284 [Eretmocerus hayati]|uniref:Uncharacterized protein n=1 Tax=Eretmocerus hayati TaxID=131215 RepID=A0ACC2PQ74_9HYME|nr:hypothetical protein QAD02_020284 [Eretmocerus hayati]
MRSSLMKSFFIRAGKSFHSQQPAGSEVTLVDKDSRYGSQEALLTNKKMQNELEWDLYSCEDSRASAAKGNSDSTVKTAFTDFASAVFPLAPASIPNYPSLVARFDEPVGISSPTSSKVNLCKEIDSGRQTLADLANIQNAAPQSCDVVARLSRSHQVPFSLAHNPNHHPVDGPILTSHDEDTIMLNENMPLAITQYSIEDSSVHQRTFDDSAFQFGHSSTVGLDESSDSASQSRSSSTLRIDESTDSASQSGNSSTLGVNDSTDSASRSGNSNALEIGQNTTPSIFNLKKRHRDYVPKTKTRKRQSDPNSWIDVQAKKARVSGEAGVGRKNKPILPKSMDIEGCGPDCPMKCTGHINVPSRKKCFGAWYKLESVQLQWEALCNWIYMKQVGKDSGTPPDSDSESEPDLEMIGKGKKYGKSSYNLPNEKGKLIPVCRKMFLKTLGISYQRVKTALKRKRESGLTGVISSDKRGRHTENRPHRVPESVKDSARAHIESFPTMESHYCREGTAKNYLDESIESLAMMYKLYIESARENNIGRVVSEHMCEKSETYKLLSKDDKTPKRDSMRKYRNDIESARKRMNESAILAKTDQSVYVMHMDLQKVLTTPRSEIGTMYYMSKISVWNFTIYEFSTSKGYCFVWNEATGNRGSNEVASYLFDHLRDVKEREAKSVHIYSDNCGGQNRNKNVFATEIRASIEFNLDIYHRFLEVGHTQAPGDSVHAMIEKKAKHKDIYSQAQWCNIMRTAKTEEPSYIVTEKTQDDIHDFTSLANLFKWDDLKTSAVKEFAVKASDPGIAFCSYGDEERNIKMTKKGITKENILGCPINKAYDGNLPLSARKEKDITTMMERGIIVDDDDILWYNTMLSTPFIPGTKKNK